MCKYAFLRSAVAFNRIVLTSASNGMPAQLRMLIIENIVWTLP